MSRILLIFTFLTFLLVSCNEKKNIIPVASVLQDTSYRINGITDINIGSLDSLSLNLNIAFNEGNQERITLSIEGLPNKVKANFTPSAGIPDYNATLNIKSSVADPGIYPINIKGKSENGLERTYKTYLNIKDDFRCDSFLVFRTGFFKTTNTMGDSVYGSSGLTRSTYVPRTYFLWLLYLGNYNGYPVRTGNLLSASDFTNVIVYNFDCNSKTIDIPEKTITVPVYSNTNTTDEEFTVSGSGTIDYEASKIFISYTVTDYLGISTKYNIAGKIKL